MAYNFAVQLAVLAITYLISYMTAPKPPNAKPASLSDFDIPTAEEGREIPVVFGTVKLTGPNVAWYGDMRSHRIRQTEGGKKFTAGYKYFVGLHMGLCHGPVDKISRIEVGEKLAWSGSITESGSITINKEALFGGYKKEGGIVGTVNVMMGGPTQGPNDYLQAKIGGPQPGYRGVTSVVFRPVYSSGFSLFSRPPTSTISSTPYIKPWAFVVTRLAGSEDGWLPEYAEPSPGDANPVHIIREVLMHRAWGMGQAVADIDMDNFAAVAQVLHAEGFGLSLTWTGRESCEDFLQRVASHVGLALRVRPDTGQWNIKLIRDDYDPDTLPVLGPGNATLIERQMPANGERVNSLQVNYTDRNSLKGTGITVQNLAGVSDQGAVINEVIDYPGIRSANIAARVAERDLTARAGPITRVTLRTDRRAWSLLPGDVFRLTWPDLGITEQVFRVGRVRYGTQAQGQITIEAMEDVFGLAATTYADMPAIGWTDPATPPAPCPQQAAIEAPYYTLLQQLSDADLAYRQAGGGSLLAWGSKPSSDASTADLITRTGTDAYQAQGEGGFAAWLLLAADVPAAKADLVIDYSATTWDDIDVIQPGTLAQLDDELLLIKAHDPATTTLTLARAVLDTVPAAHSVGARLWCWEDAAGQDLSDYAGSTIVDAKLLPTTSLGTLDESLATAMPVIIAGRSERPYPPGDLAINGADYPEAIIGALSITWAHRDRLTQGLSVVEQTGASIGPEAGTTYALKIYDEDGLLVVDEAALAVTSYSYSTEAADLGKTVNQPGEVYAGASNDWQSLSASLTRAAQWLMDDLTGATTLADDVGTYALTVAGVPTFEQPPIMGATGYSIEFNGSAYAVGTGAALATTAAAFTVELAFEYDFLPTTFTGLFDLETNGANGFYCFLSNNASYADLQFGGDQFVHARVDLGGPPVGDGRHHLLITYNGQGATTLSNYTLYFDGAAVPLIAASAVTGTTNQTQIARSRSNNGGPVVVDGFTVYAQHVDAQQAADLHNAFIGSGQSPTPLRLNTSMTMTLGAVRDSLDSHQQHSITIQRAGYGYNYGNYYGGI